MSASLTPKIADLLGVPAGERTWMELPSQYPRERTPIYHIKTIRVDYKASEVAMRQWVNRIDQFIERRMDRKGIIFPVSYQRRDFYLANTRHPRRMFYAHDRDDVAAVVSRFRSARPPAVLISPSVTRGWDFPGDDCRYIVIGKIPFADQRDQVTQARVDQDPDFGGFDALQTIVQEAGRGTRGADDRCEVAIFDDHWLWFWRRNQHHAPQFFRDRVLPTFEAVPDPLVTA